MINVNDEIHHVELGDREVKDWRVRSNKILLYGKYEKENQLRADWQRYQDQNIDDQRESDWKSIELFNLPNKDRYEKMLAVFLRADINDDLFIKQYIPMKESAQMDGFKEYAEKSDPISAALTCLRMNENTIVNRAVTEATKKNLEDKIMVDNNVSSEKNSPYFSPDELEKIGVSYLDGQNPRFSDEPDNILIGNVSTKLWFHEYKNKFLGVNCTESIGSKVWKETVLKLYSDFGKIKESGDLKSINARKQSILDLGWNPEIEFTQETSKFAKGRIDSVLKGMYENYTLVDIEESVSLAEEANPNILTEVVARPIFIVFFNSKTFFNKVVRVATKSVYNHVAISFDPNLKTIYSFSGTTGGFEVDTLKRRIDEGQDRAIQVFCIFVDPGRYNVLKAKVSQYGKHKKDFGYSFINLITIPFKINYIDNTKMVCSQFVDSMLKLADLDFTKIGSNMISPGYLNAKMKMKKYRGTIYKIYTGAPSKYSEKKITRVLNSIGNSMGYKLEGCEFLRPFVEIIPIKEAKEFPIQFSDDGDLLISKGTDVDFEGEYSRCHIAMQQYAKAKNVEGMKYCLCKLWYLNILLEEKIHNDRKDKEKLKEYHKARAKIINDITTYMKEVQKLDKNFDMLKEYNDSPFNDNAVKIRRSTLLYTIDLFKRLIGVK